MLAADARELKRALNHACGGVAIVGESARGEGTVVGANAHRAALLLALEHKGGECLLNVVELSLVVRGVLVVDLLERLAAVGEVPRVDANLVEALSNHHGDLGRKVDVGDEGRVVSLLEAPLLDLVARLGLPVALHGQADELRAGVGAAHDLVDAALHVARHTRRHRLQRDRVLAPDLHRPGGDGAGGAPLGLVHVLAVLEVAILEHALAAVAHAKRRHAANAAARLQAE
mmetsp:Transcript_11565/g.28359  ORF Transcript_11565/g.28359 Transcript_11565/m.28359 type:complete len:230 (+) Transcript_11565:1754-2443(+)